MPVVGDLVALLMVAADVLNQAGEVGPVSTSCCADRNTVEFNNSTGWKSWASLADQRPTIDRIAEVLGVESKHRHTAGPFYSVTAQGTVGGTEVLALALTPINRGRPVVRVTTTRDAVALLRNLVPWVRTLDLAVVNELTVHDGVTKLHAQLQVNREEAVEEVLAGLPRDELPAAYRRKRALLTTGHTVSALVRARSVTAAVRPDPLVQTAGTRPDSRPHREEQFTADVAC